MRESAEVLASEDAERRPRLADPEPEASCRAPPCVAPSQTRAFRSWADGGEDSPALEELVLVKPGRGEQES